VKVYVYPADLGGCGYYRLIWPAKILQSMGHDVVLVHPKQNNKLSGGTDASGKLVSLSLPRDADVMVFQRVSSRMMVEAIPLMRKNGIAVVIDIDDDMSAIDQRNPAWAVLHPKSTGHNAEYDWNSARRACSAATYVTVSTDALLKRYTTQGRGVVLHNAVPEIFLDETKFPRVDNETIGWAGALFSHPDDPQVTGVSMCKLQREGYTFKIVGAPKGTREAFKLDRDPVTTGPVPVDQWPTEVNRLGVGIAPLNDTRFNEAKSWLKMLEYAALGVPCIGSPRAEYRRIYARGVGLLAQSPKDWYRLAQELLRNASLRNELSESGRDAARSLVIEKQAWRWWEAWSVALQLERGPLGIRPTVATIPDRP
jgi:glycosyltransferase involved in cell wall biosynthesis